MELVPGTLQLTECLSLCSANATCQAINFETGLCVLFSSSANQRPASLTPSQFPVFTIYAHKVCLLGRKRCNRDWMFERVNGYELRDVARSSAIVMSREACMELCLNEIQFQCRSANYNRMTGECFLSDKDRTSLSLTATNRHFGPSSESVDYLESNCLDDIFKPISRFITNLQINFLKTQVGWNKKKFLNQITDQGKISVTDEKQASIQFKSLDHPILGGNLPNSERTQNNDQLESHDSFTPVTLFLGLFFPFLWIACHRVDLVRNKKDGPYLLAHWH
ncbi:uncharacterized protein CDAR_81041 [Caerostris darwini]|uniref:Apple domain-containing protein n=1 Tax=Caerostris darwini TaxID=1538125 RepID=A0AAV4SFH7_9ARAC|nr:uncharacterized protein CDAR_81041 [Caerostris darwini]